MLGISDSLESENPDALSKWKVRALISTENAPSLVFEHLDAHRRGRLKPFAVLGLERIRQILDFPHSRMVAAASVVVKIPYSLISPNTSMAVR